MPYIASYPLDDSNSDLVAPLGRLSFADPAGVTFLPLAVYTTFVPAHKHSASLPAWVAGQTVDAATDYIDNALL